ncbi:MAG: CoA ester lyase, partial [Lysobacteraceae bacterium]
WCHRVFQVDDDDAVAAGQRVGKALRPRGGHEQKRHRQCDALRSGVAAMSADERSRVLVRVNAAGTTWHHEDLALCAALVAQGLAGVMLPKAESAAVLAHAADVLGPAAQLVPLIESGAGLDALDAIGAAPQVARLAFGHLDFMADLGMACEDDEPELMAVRLALVRASHRAGLAAPVDGVTVDTRDEARVARDAARSRRMGFGAKLCIHPNQVAAVSGALLPSAAEREWAARVTARAADGEAVFTLDGRMVDAPVILRARRILALSGARP